MGFGELVDRDALKFQPGSFCIVSDAAPVGVLSY